MSDTAKALETAGIGWAYWVSGLGVDWEWTGSVAITNSVCHFPHLEPNHQIWRGGGDSWSGGSSEFLFQYTNGTLEYDQQAVDAVAPYMSK
jgi:hypothetical protein